MSHRLPRSLATAALAVALAAAGLLAGPARGHHFTRTCTVGPLTTTILSTPVTVRLYSVHNLNTKTRQWTLCIDSAPAAPGAMYQEFTLQVPGDPVPQGAYVFAQSDGVGATAAAGAAAAPTLTALGDGTYTLQIPMALCVGGACPVNSAPGVGKSGVQTSGITTNLFPQGLATGGTVAVSTLTVWANGASFPIPVNGGGGALIGATTAFGVKTGTPVTIPFCAGSGNCREVSVPAYGVYYDGMPLVTLVVGSSSTPITIPGGRQCLVAVNMTTC